MQEVEDRRKKLKLLKEQASGSEAPESGMALATVSNCAKAQVRTLAEKLLAWSKRECAT